MRKCFATLRYASHFMIDFCPDTVHIDNLRRLDLSILYPFRV